MNIQRKKHNWQPINLIMEPFTWQEIVNWYKNANLYLDIPLANRMNLVSIAYIIEASMGQKKLRKL